MELSALAWIHTVLSVVALVSGVIVASGLLASRMPGWWTVLFFVTAIATSATGFALPSAGFQASHGVGIASLVVLVLAIVAFYVFHLAGAWRWIYAVGAVLGLYFDVFVAIAQAFKKVPALSALAPTLSEPPFGVAQLVCLALFAVLSIAAAVRFRPETASVHMAG
jgi:hypothetical protein